MTVIGSLTPPRTSVLVSVAGELDLATGPAFCDALTDVSLANEDVVADVSRLEFCDCAGLNALIRTRRWAAAHGARLWVHGVPPHLARLLSLTGSSSAIPCSSQGIPAFRPGGNAILGPEARSAGDRYVCVVTVRPGASGSRCSP